MNHGEFQAVIPGDRSDETERRVRLADSRVLACLEIGAPSGTPVMYFHGFPGFRPEGRLAADAARRRGLRLLAPDRPGFGASTRQPRRTLAGWAADAGSLADTLGIERFSVVGVSGGGPYALACAAGLPDRVGGVAVVAGLGPLTRPGATRGMGMLNRFVLGTAGRLPRLTRGLVGLLAQVVRRYPERYLAHMLADAPAADRAVLADPGYRSLILASTAEALRYNGRGVAQELVIFTRPWDFDIQRIAVSVDLWQGGADRIVPPIMMESLLAELPRGIPHRCAGEGHLSLIVRYLDRVLADLPV
jgi:pimeloyl-ACP methyl ester carboxylesterase